MNCFDDLRRIRKEIFLTAYNGKCKDAHIASSFSIVEILYVLYNMGIARVDANNPSWDKRDRVILSKGHGCLALYQVLKDMGFFSGLDLCGTFCFPDSVFGGEPNMMMVPGVEASTGSLGHGLPFAVGIAMGLKHINCESKVYVILGDGECEEGTIWESAMIAANDRLDNIVVIVDCNKLQKMDSVKEIAGISDWTDKWKSFGWQVDNSDGHDIDMLYQKLSKNNEKGYPRVIIANTIKGRGVSIMENSIDWHYRKPRGGQINIFKKELGIVDDSEMT